MTQEDKELLLKDIYARIPYGVKGCCEDETFCTTPLQWYAENTLEYSVNYMVIKNGWRPYLFPLSSMTEEQRKEYESLCIKETCECTDLYGIIFTKDYCYNTVESIDYLYKNHIDIRGLIPKGLANDATGLNIY